MNRIWRHLAVTAAAMVFSSVASAGVIGDFEVQAFGFFEDENDAIAIVANVVEQDPDFGFELFEALFLVDEGQDPAIFSGEFTLTSPDGLLFAEAAGALFSEELFIVKAGVFVITGGTGIFDGVTGVGVISGFANADNDTQYIQLGGTIVPTPAALALFGAAGFVSRRRRRN